MIGRVVTFAAALSVINGSLVNGQEPNPDSEWIVPSSTGNDLYNQDYYPPGFGLPPRFKPQPLFTASATLISESGENEITGLVTFKQFSEVAPVITMINVTGLSPGKHAIHIHSYGDVSEGCNSTGPHYRNSLVGNAEAKSDGSLEIEFPSPYLSLLGPNNIIGRSIVIHEKPIEYNRFPDIQPAPTDVQQDYPNPSLTEEQKVGEIMACGIITIKKN